MLNILFFSFFPPVFKPLLYLKWLLFVLDLFQQVTELSRPSSLEVEEIIQQLVQSVLRRFFKDERTSDFIGDSVEGSTANHPDGDDEFCDTTGASRDYLAKLLFWLVFLIPFINCLFSGFSSDWFWMSHFYGLIICTRQNTHFWWFPDAVASQGLFTSY